MEAETALAELLDLSAGIEAAIVLEGERIVASSVAGEQAERFARAVLDVAAVAERVKPGRPAPLVRAEAVLGDGLLVLRREDGRTAAAVAGGGATASLVLHDLTSLLRRLEEDRRASG